MLYYLESLASDAVGAPTDVCGLLEFLALSGFGTVNVRGVHVSHGEIHFELIATKLRVT